jgi:rhamnosyltransferase
MLNKEKIAGTVVLFHPDNKVILNIKSYIKEMGKLYVIDNSEIKNQSLVNSFYAISNIEYIHAKDNMGIAKALNIAATRAFNDGYSYLLTMDQDSSLSYNTIDEYYKYLLESKNSNIGILTLRHNVKNYIYHPPDNSYTNVNTAFTSGSLMNLNAFINIGPFKEKFFMDYVDHEYCLRLKKNHYKIIRINSAFCNHELGNLETRKILGLNIPVTNHSPQRLYYRTRNRLYVVSWYFKTFPFWVFIDIMRFFYETIIVILYESQKKEKIQMIFKGFNDFLQGKSGKLIEN